ncbi:MAG: HAD-IIIA family hydrolase [Proteobacteria bacterium]|nr:HAD-IIIA family hydrolase [Pseudomonadota bacterium]
MKKAVFFDRDGVLVRSLVGDGKPYAARTIEEFEILPESGGVTRDLAEAGFPLLVFTNQPDVGNGLVERSVVEEMNRILQQTLPLTAVKVCYHSQTEGCACRKPKPGMLIEAAREFDLDLSQSYVVGDRKSDIEAGNAAGCFTIFIDRGYREQSPDDADKRVHSLAEARDFILALEDNAIE